MKKWVIPGLLFLLVFACATYQIVTVPPKIDTNKVKKIAVLDFSNYTESPNVGKILARKLTVKLVQSQVYSVIEREQIESIIKEQKISASGVIDVRTAAKIGRIAGVDAIILGSVSRCDIEKTSSRYDGTYYTANCDEINTTVVTEMRVIDVKTGEILWANQAQESQNYKNYSSVQEKNVQKTATISSSVEQKDIIRETVMIPPGARKYWSFFASAGTDISANINAADGVNAWIGSTPENYYRYTYRANLQSGTIDFKSPQSQTYYLVVENKNLFLSKSVSLLVTASYTKQTTTPSDYNPFLAISEKSELTTENKSPKILLEETIDKVVNKLYLDLVPHEEKRLVNN